MPRKPPSPLPGPVIAEFPQRLHNAAAAFYFAAILSSAPFYGGGATPNRHNTVSRALEGMLNSSNKNSEATAPAVVNFAFAIELYLKLLRFLADGRRMQGHNLYNLFLKLETAAPDVGAIAIRQHRYACGDRDVFLEYLAEVKSAFEEWRYAHEKGFLVVTPDNLHALADAFRATMNELHPGRHSVFEKAP